jgi:hypothetical protein
MTKLLRAKLALMSRGCPSALHSKVIWAIAASLSLAACGSGAQHEEASPDQKLLDEAKAYIKSVARDPDSVQFRNLKVHNGADYNYGNSMAVCGEYNARNGFGGFGGFERFAYQGKSPGHSEMLISAELLGNQTAFDWMEPKICRDKPVP